MIPVTGFAGRRVAVFGLGASGLSTVRALVAGGATPLAWDDSDSSRAALAAEGIEPVDLAAADWTGVAALILSPGVPLTHPEPHWTVPLARAANAEVIGDIELFARERRRAVPQAPLVCITGTNGKSTTTALISHLLAAAGRDVQLGGNIGTPVLSLEPPAMGRYHVLECSSFQIELAPTLDPTVGVLLNLSPDHIDRHGTFERYAGVKEQLVEASRVAVIGVDDRDSALIADHLQQDGQSVVRISAVRPLAAGIMRDGDVLVAVADGGPKRIASLAGIGSLRGQHNAQNAAAAVAAVRALGVADATIAAALRTFPGLPHRLEEVGRLGPIVFINDSKATNADAAGKALASFNRIYWIVGGRPKTDGIGGLGPLFPRVAKAFLIGEAAEAFAATLKEGNVPCETTGTMDKALAAATDAARRDPAPEVAVLLSPAAASFDQFTDFRHRGDVFRTLVGAIGGIERKGAAA
ncbi:MAG: UDP-N-acetylmuramoyl-L-alanine--D-glutamate ligase [Bauldia sp.]|nr:UDP-N-acetylmuramoyl-L-alanine--D-glutamate ligase [Bauldia sp.]